MGRFINADCQLYTGDLFGLNLFAYCGNNPVMNTDPNGEFFFTALGLIGGFISGVITALMTEENPTLESVLEIASHSAIGGAIAGLGVDIGLTIIAGSGGAALPVVGAFAVSYIMGGLGNLYTSYATSDNGLSGDEAVGTFVVGGTFNCLSLATGLGATASTLGGMFKKGMSGFAENLITGIFIGISTSIATGIGVTGVPQ